MDEMLTLKEAARFLKLSYDTMLRFWKSGELPAADLGGARSKGRGTPRILKSDLLAWYRSRQQKVIHAAAPMPSKDKTKWQPMKV